MLVASTSFSQIDSSKVSLRPDSVLMDRDGVPTHFAWRVDDQVPILVEHILRAEAARQIENMQDSALTHCDTLVDKQSVLIRSYESQIANREQKIHNQHLQIDTYRKEEERLNTHIRILKVKVIVIPITTLVLGYYIGRAL